jgi:ATP-dependent exoDNAse (exonuclease V) alpha subunit
MYEKILDALEEKKIALLTGPGGTGKTYNINRICENVSNVARTATTGIAATHLSGETIHRFSSMGVFSEPNSIYRIVQSPFFDEVEERINLANLIVIDEVSMLHRKQFELLGEIFKEATGNYKEPFGGKKVLLSGDFLQLPPVNKRETTSPWIFHSKLWKEINPEVIELTKIWRQDNKEFGEALLNIRKGICTQVENEMIASREGATFKDVLPVKLVATNKEADKINQAELAKLDTKTQTFGASVEIRNWEHMTDKQYKFHYDNLVKDMIAPEKLTLKVGAQVMALKNGDNYCNGTMGKVIKLDKFGAEVLTTNGEFIRFEKDDWTKLDSTDEEIAKFSQVPLKLAYAVTVHKSQGMTLDYCQVDFGRVFSPGQSYVALSRVRSLEGLSALNWRRRKVWCDRDAYNFYAKKGEEK